MTTPTSPEARASRAESSDAPAAGIGFEVDPAVLTFIWLIGCRHGQGRPINPSSADMVETPSRMFIIQRVALVDQHHAVPCPSSVLGV